MIAPRPVSAGEWSLHAAVDGYLAATDNVFATSGDIPMGPPREGDVYAQVRPGLLYTYEGPRAIHELTVGLDATGYATHQDAWSLAAHGGWRTVFSVSPRTDGDAGASASFGTINALTASAPANAGQPQLLPAGDVQVLTTAANQGLRYAINESLQLQQTAIGQLVDTSTAGVDDAADTTTRGVSVGFGLGLERAWRSDAVGLDVGVSFDSLRAEVATGPLTQDQVLTRATLRWRHDLGRYWSSSLDAGVATLVAADAGGAWSVRPTVGAQLVYAPEWGVSSLAVRRSVAPNLFIAQNTQTTGAIAAVQVPLPWLSRDPRAPELFVAGTAAYDRTELLDLTTDSTVSTFGLISGDVALTWAPKPAYALSLRFQYVKQDQLDDNLMMALADLSYTRSTVLLTFSARFPDRLAGTIPKRSGRVDKRDLTPIGDGSSR